MSGDLSSCSGRSVGSVVRPQKVLADKTVVQSVVDFINDVLPQGTPPHKANDKEVIVWIRIDQPERIGDISEAQSPIYLTFGYASGVQIWAIEPHGEAWEVYSSRQGPVRIFRLLPAAEEVLGAGDAFSEKRPLAAVCDGSTNPPYTGISIISLVTGERVHSLKYRSPVEDILANQRVMVVTFPDRLIVLNACTFKERMVINASFPVHLVSPNPVALGRQWLAHSENKLHDVYHSLGGRMIDGVPSYTASVISAAKTISQGLTNISEVVASSFAQAPKRLVPTNSFVGLPQEGKLPQEGVVTVLDIGTSAQGDGEVSLEKGTVNRAGVVAHFLAHSSSSVACLAFNPDGSLLLTASQTGQHFHLFRIQPHPLGSCMAVVHHLYTLHRGDTNATLQDIAFSLDSRWVAVTSARATTHVFPITPYGGAVSCRTHACGRVVNKASRFHRSAGLDDLDVILSSGPILATAGLAPVSTSPRYADAARPQVQVQAPPTAPYSSSSSSSAAPAPSQRLAHFHPPVIVQPLIQIKHSGPAKALANATKTAPLPADTVKVAACFAARRSRTGNEQSSNDALLIATSHGALVEYSLQPLAASSQTEKAGDEAAVGLSVHAQSQWLLNRHLGQGEFVPPFQPGHPLVCSRALGSREGESGAGEQGHSSNDGLGRSRANTQEKIVNLHENETWLSQVEIVTNAGPARRLWMGPQFRFTPLTAPHPYESCGMQHVHALGQAEIMRTGSDWDLSDLKLANLRIRSAPVNLATASGSCHSLIIESSSAPVDRVLFTGQDYLSRESNSSDDLRVSEIADAMVEVAGLARERDRDRDRDRDMIDGPIHRQLKGYFDESPEELSISSAESNHSGPAASLLTVGSSALQSGPDGDAFYPLPPTGDYSDSRPY